MIKKSEAVSHELPIATIEIKKAALIYRAINHRLRQQLLKLIHNHKEITVTDLYTKMDLEQSVASQHLAILRRAGMVNTRRDSKKIFYSVNYGRIKEIHDITSRLLNQE